MRLRETAYQTTALRVALALLIGAAAGALAAATAPVWTGALKAPWSGAGLSLVARGFGSAFPFWLAGSAFFGALPWILLHGHGYRTWPVVALAGRRPRVHRRVRSEHARLRRRAAPEERRNLRVGFLAARLFFTAGSPRTDGRSPFAGLSFRVRLGRSSGWLFGAFAYRKAKATEPSAADNPGCARRVRRARRASARAGANPFPRTPPSATESVKGGRLWRTKNGR